MYTVCVNSLIIFVQMKESGSFTVEKKEAFYVLALLQFFSSIAIFYHLKVVKNDTKMKKQNLYNS